MVKKIAQLSIFFIFSISLIGGDVENLMQGLNPDALKATVQKLSQIPEQLIKNMPESLSRTSILAGTGLFLMLLGGYYVSKNVKKMSSTVKEAYEKIQKSLLGTTLGIGAIYGGGALLKVYGPLAGGAFFSLMFPPG